MQNNISQNEKDKILESFQNKLKEVVNPNYLDEIEKIVKKSLNPLLSQSEVSKIPIII